MNKLIKIILFVIFFCQYASAPAQEKKETYISKKALIGTWQKDSYRVGNGLNQNFQFFNDGRFIFTNGNFGDDAVSTIKLKGTYRLTRDSLFFTIRSKTIVDGELEMIDPGIEQGIFQYGSKSTIKEVKVANPKEIEEPCFVAYLKRGKIKLNTEVYYKVVVLDNER